MQLADTAEKWRRSIFDTRLGDAVDTSGIVIFIVVRTYFVIPAEGQRGQGDIAPVDFPIIFHAARTHFREDSVKNSDVFSG